MIEEAEKNALLAWQTRTIARFLVLTSPAEGTARQKLADMADEVNLAPKSDKPKEPAVGSYERFQQMMARIK